MKNQLYIYKTGRGDLILSNELPDVNSDETLQIAVNQTVSSYVKIDIDAIVIMSGLAPSIFFRDEDYEKNLISEMEEYLENHVVLVGSDDFRESSLSIDDIKNLKSN